MTVDARFEELRLAALAADEEFLGDCRALEPILCDMLRLVLTHPESQAFFTAQFVRMATGELSSPAELVPFCMRELKLPEVLLAVRAHFQTLYGANKHAHYMSYCGHVVKAYEDFVWEDADMWDYYRTKELVPSTVPALAERLGLPDPDAQFNALLALESIGPAARVALPAVQEFLNRQPGSSNLAARARLVVQAMQGSNPSFKRTPDGAA